MYIHIYIYMCTWKQKYAPYDSLTHCDTMCVTHIVTSGSNAKRRQTRLRTKTKTCTVAHADTV